MSKYDCELDLDSKNSLSIIIKMLKPNSKILEFGPANGRLTKYLNKVMECNVDIVEIDEEAGLNAAQYSNKSFLGEQFGDIEKYIWLDELKNEKYDFIIFADVLEHLRNPFEVVKKCKSILNKNGSVVLSVPNIAHNSIIIDLINDEFKYNNLGLLDNTHINFFSYKRLMRMIENNGYVSVNQESVNFQVGENEIKNDYSYIDKKISKVLRQREKGTIYQYVFKIKKKEDVIELCEPMFYNLDKNLGYKTCLYFKEKNSDYCENKKIECYTKLFRINTIKFNMSDIDNITEIRIDPIDTNCLIKIIDIYTISNNKRTSLEIKNMNGNKVYDNLYVFSNDDPQIYLKIKDKQLGEVYFEYEFIDYDNDELKIYDGIFKILSNKNSELSIQNADILFEKDNAFKEINCLKKEVDNLTDQLEEAKKIIENYKSQEEDYKSQLEVYKSQLEDYNVQLNRYKQSMLGKIQAKIFNRKE